MAPNLHVFSWRKFSLFSLGFLVVLLNFTIKHSEPEITEENFSEVESAENISEEIIVQENNEEEIPETPQSESSEKENKKEEKEAEKIQKEERARITLVKSLITLDIPTF